MSIKVGPFTLYQRLGAGGMGEVWLARHSEQDVEVALKVMTASGSKEARYRESFAREVRAVASLDHPGIVRVLDSGEITAQESNASKNRFPTATPYLVMELAMGTLRDMDGQLIRWSQQRTILLRILDALAHAHARGVIHRDLKPENILLLSTEEGPRLKLADFGLAQAYQEREDDDFEKVIVGTPRFMAPEQILGNWRDQGPWTDLYALGCLAYWLISGVPPYSGEKTEEILRGHLEGALPPLYALDDVPEGLGQWLQTMMSRDPKDRFRFASDAAFALRSLDPHLEEWTDELSEEKLAAMVPGADGQDPFTGETPKEKAQSWRDVSLTMLLSETLTLPNYEFSLPLLSGSTSSPAYSIAPFPSTWEEGSRERFPTKSDHLRGVGLGLYGLRQLPMINRIQERDDLWEALKVVKKTGHPCSILLKGHQGLGKSRLARWLAERAHELGAADYLLLRHSPLAANTQSLARLVAQQIRAAGLSREEILERIRNLFSTKGSLDSDLLHDCMALTELVAPVAARNYSPEQSRLLSSSPVERYALLARFLARILDRPLVLIFDDLQWGLDSLGFLRYLLSQNLPIPLLVISTLRVEALKDRPLETHSIEALLTLDGSEGLEIGPLSEADHRRLVHALLGLKSSLSEEVILRTRGNPLFAVQLVGDWVSREILKATPEGFQLQPGASVELPEDISTLLDERLERIIAELEEESEELFTLLEIGATFGLEVDLREWKRASSLLRLIIPSSLLDAMLLARFGILKEGHFAFLHGAIQECLLRRARRGSRLKEHHRVCADTILGLYQKGTPGLASRVGLHLYEAEHFRSAAPFLLEAADEARITSDFSRAYDLFDRHKQAIEFLDPAGKSEELSLQMNLNRIRRARTEIKHNLLKEASQRLQKIDYSTLSPLLQGEYYFAVATLGRARGDIQGGLDAAENSIDAYEKVQNSGSFRSNIGIEDPLLGLSKTLTVKADLLQSSGALKEALQIAEMAYQLASGHANEVAACHLQLGSILHALGEGEKALLWLKKALISFREVGNIHGIAQTENSLGEHYRAIGDSNCAQEHYGRALTLLKRAGVTHLGTVLFNLGICALDNGEIDRAEQQFQIVHQELLDTGAKGYLAVTSVALMATAASRGDFFRAQDLLEATTEIMNSTGFIIPDIAVLAQKAAASPNAPEEFRTAIQDFLFNLPYS